MSNQGLPHRGQPVYTAGQPLNEAKAAMILVHGRGATAPSILELANALYHPDFVYLAPQAANNTWYPNSFLSPIPGNEPDLSSGLAVLGDLIAQIEAAGIPAEKIVLAGFSQGACLASEFVARNARPYGGLLAFSGGVIGPPGTPRNYEGSLEGMPVFVGCSDSDFHIPVERVHESTAVFEALGAAVTERIYPNMGHTIIQDEIDQARGIVEGVVTA
ncbi:MAG: dienelactone hydrolase family protein [Anaerolineae bacterium]|nr:dienelactone hydrolase family protein [Anaerolineae bacterium]MCB9102920.1 dienelactone hydrolase family protein [Anaerolineales bacterium]